MSAEEATDAVPMQHAATQLAATVVSATMDTWGMATRAVVGNRHV